MMSGRIAFALLLAFVLFVMARGELGEYRTVIGL